VVLLSAAMAGAAAADTTPATEYANGCTGTDGATPCASNRIEIATLAQLRRLSERSQDWSGAVTVVLTGNINAADTVTWNVGDHDNDGLTADVPMGFSPIGSEFVPFEGSFDGAGFTISNLAVNRPGTGRVGLFGTANSAVIENIGLSDVAIEGDGSVGGLVGYATSGTAITNSHASGTVTGNNNWVGGLVGYANSTSIADSYATAATVSSGNSVGGLMGYAVTVDVTASNATGTVTGAENVGGLVGYARQTSTLTNSYARGDVVGTLRVGGLVGYARESSSITASHAAGAVSGSGSNGAAGGLVGSLGLGSITASYATGAVGGVKNVGGLVGNAFNNSSITDSYATGAVEVSLENVGGLVGNGITNSSITDSYWDTDKSTQLQGVGSTDGTLTGTPTGLTSTEMLAQSSFVGFDFVTEPPGDPVSDTPWVMIDGKTQPYLYWQDDDGDGVAAYVDPDDDNDGVDDDNDAFPLISLGGLTDTDGDGRPNDCDTACQASGMSADTDDDNDGVVDDNDRYPLVSLTVNAGTANEETLSDANGNGVPDAVGANCDEACIILAGMALDQAPTAVDVYAATLVSTAVSPQSATVVLEGADPEADALTYTVVSEPSNGTLLDPNNGNSVVTIGAIAGQTLTYTPEDGFTSTDTFTYMVNDGVSDSTTTYTATITVFDGVRTQARQIGADIDGEAAGDYSGWSVALSSDGQTLAVGAYPNDGNGSAAGHVRVYAWNGLAWAQLGADIDGEAAGDFSGYSVALSSDGQTLAVGAFQNDGNGTDAGHVRVYAWDGSAWSQLGADIDGEAAGDQSGSSVALSSDGQTLAVGAYLNNGNGSAAGHVRVYEWSGSAWSQLGADIDGEAAGDRSGISVALSSDGQTLAVGAYLNDGNGSAAGHVRVYAWDGSAWTQLGADIDGEVAGDESGYSVALSSDGQTLAVGAYRNAGTGDAAGHVRVYDWDGSAWSQLGGDIDGEAAGDYSGRSVALSSDGQTVAIGARFNNGNGDAAGHVRVYAWNGSAWAQLGADIDGGGV
jgi:hypothetical protein